MDVLTVLSIPFVSAAVAMAFFWSLMYLFKEDE